MKYKYFYGDNCPSCRTVKPLIETLDNVEYINAEKESDKAYEYNIFSLPTLMIFDDNGDYKNQISGVFTKEDIEKIS